MASKRITVEQREQLVDLFESGVGSYRAARIVGCSPSAAQNICNRWRIHGRLMLVKKQYQTHYDVDVKLEAVTRFLQGETSLAIAKDLHLASTTIVHRWVRAYRAEGEEGLRNKPRGRRSSKPEHTTGETTGSCKRQDEVEQLKRCVQWLEMENAYLQALRDFNDAHE